MNLTNREAINLFRMAMDPDLGDPYRNSPYLEGVPWPDLPTQQTVVTSDLVEFP